MIGCFVTSQAQINYNFTNSTGETWKFNTPGFPSISIPTGTVTGTLPDAVTVPFDFSVFGTVSGCAGHDSVMGLMGTTAIGLAGCAGTPPNVTFSYTGPAVTGPFTFYINIF